MSTSSQSHQAFHHGTAPIFSMLSREQLEKIIEMRGDAAIAERMTVLGEKANEGELSEDERAEYEAYIEANNLLAILQAEARFRLAQGEF